MTSVLATCRTSCAPSGAPPASRRARSGNSRRVNARFSKSVSRRRSSLTSCIEEVTMYDHIGLRVKDLGASVRFYETALAALGYTLCSRDASGAGLGPKGEPALWLHASEGAAGGGAHVAF